MTHLKEIAAMIKASPRSGRSIDEPEGSCYILLSHTLANRITIELNNAQSSFDMALADKRKKIKYLQGELNAFKGIDLPILTTNHLEAERKNEEKISNLDKKTWSVEFSENGGEYMGELRIKAASVVLAGKDKVVADGVEINIPHEYLGDITQMIGTNS